MARENGPQDIGRFDGEYIRDGELRTLLLQGSDALGEQGLNRLITAHQRFDKPVTVHEKDGRQRIEPHWDLKQVLAEVPGYVDASREAGLPSRKSEDLLIHLLDATPYDFERNEINISLLGRALHQEGRLGGKFLARDLTRLNRLIALGGKYGVIPHSLHGFTLARRAGLSRQDSTALVMHLPDADGDLAGYSFPAFNQAMATLSIAEADPALTRETFKALGGERPYYRTGAYRTFEEAITFGCPSREITPEELMRAYSIHGQGQDIEEFLDRVFGDDTYRLPISEPQVDILLPHQQRERHFLAKPGRLEHAALPYRTQLPFNEGVQDLERLAIAQGHKVEAVGEGYWVFDPDSETWYSFGGKTEVGADRVRHNFIPYDISDLSRRPLLLHIHPEDLEIMLRSPRDEFPSREYRDHATKFLSSTPSRADYAVVAQQIEVASGQVQPRSFIVHSLGITEFVYPTDLEVIKKMSVDSRDIRDQAMLNFPWKDLMNRPAMADELTVVRDLISGLNRMLPSGFLINFYPRGTSIS